MATVTGTAIAAAGLRYRGQGYVYGGTGARPGDWDCSSFISYVLGHDLGLKLPGGTWQQVTNSGRSHGPVVEDYARWGTPTAQPAIGDLACWVGLGTGGHIGIVTGPDKMISALDTQQGTVATPIAGTGPAGAPLVYRHPPTVPAGAPVTAPGQPRSSSLAGAAMGLLIAAGMAGVTLAAAAGVGVLAAAGLIWAGRRLTQQ